MNKKGAAICVSYGELFDYLENALERRPTPNEFDEFKAWVLRDLPQWLVDNTKSFLRNRVAEQPRLAPHEMCKCGHSRSRHCDVEKEGDGLGMCAVHSCECDKFEKAEPK